MSRNMTAMEVHGAPLPAATLAPTLGDFVPAQSLPARDEELWIIEKNGQAPAAGSPQNFTADADQLLPGSGMLLNVKGSTLTPVPLKETIVHADIDGCIASVDVHQRFDNSSKELADVLYEFPLPQNGAVNEFVLSIGKRHIRGIVRERAEAEKIYREARGQGFLASLMVQQSPNMFIQRAANLEPGGQIDVEIRYFHTVPYRDGSFEFEFPMIAGLRERGMPLVEQRDGRNITLTVHINAGMPIEGVECPTHEMAFKTTGNIADATLTPADRISNRDLVLRYKLAGDEVKSSLITEKDGDGGTFALLLVPPATTAHLPRRPLEMIFALDSFTDHDEGLAAADVLRNLIPSDTFEIVCPIGSSPPLSYPPVLATPPNVHQAMREFGVEPRFLQTILTFTDVTRSSVGSRTGDALRRALIEPQDPSHLRVVCLLTGGHRSLPSSLAVVPPALGSARIVVVGVGPSPDRDAIESIARAGRGAAVYFPPGDAALDVAKRMMERLSHPAISDIQIDWNGASVTDVLPAPTPDLFVGHAVLFTGRFHGPSPQEIKLSGNLGDGVGRWTVVARSTDLPGRTPIASIWARRKIADLASSAAAQPNPDFEKQIRQIALDHGLLCRYTAFITVDALTQAAEK